jgi:dystrophin
LSFCCRKPTNFHLFSQNIETFIKSHSAQSKERINELSRTLIEKKILIQLANSDTKEFQFRWQLLLDDAQRKLQSLDAAINDVQSWEKRLLELQEWVTYMDKYLFTRIEQDIFADDVPEDFARIHEEFVQNEFLLKELDDGVERYRAQGKLDAATRLDQQMSIMKKNWAEVNHKFKKFQKPADFDQKLNKVQKLLDEIEQALYMIEVTTEDSDTIHLQLEHCMKFYKTLSELKGQIEFVLKQGRSIVDKKQVDDTAGLTRQLDNLKQKYNDLGSRVTNGKNELEKAFKVAKKFRKEYNVISDFMGKIDGELRKIEQKPLSKNYMDELEWIKNTKSEINKVETINLQTMHALKRSFDELVHKSSTPKNLTAHTKIREIEEKVAIIQGRIDDRADFLRSEANKLEANFHSFLEGSRQVMLTIERLQQQLMEAEHSEVFDSVEREVNLLLTDVEMCRVQGTELCSKSEQYSKTVETELRSMLVSFEELNRRLNMAQVGFFCCCFFFG